MNRGRRRGCGPGLLGLRDGVKRRLFDPNSVPTKPDVKYEVNRLPPLTGATNLTCPTVYSLLEKLQKGSKSTGLSLLKEKSVKEPHILTSKAMLEFAFRHSPFYHTLPVRPEGIQLNAITPADNMDKTDMNGSVSLPHLFLLHKEISLWKDGSILRNLEDPNEWYPTELAECSRLSGNVKKQKMRKRHNFVPPIKESALPLAQPIEATVDYGEVAQEEGVGEVDQGKDSDDSDDARWNGEVNAEEDPNEIDEEELENDYCLTYFDNGEGDLSDDPTAGDDDGGGRYFD